MIVAKGNGSKRRPSPNRITDSAKPEDLTTHQPFHYICEKTKDIKDVYNTWSDKDRIALQRMYYSAAKEEIMATIPNGSWKAICERAHAWGLHRSYKAKGDAIRRGKKRNE